jgi:prephenate dehydratase
MPGIPPSRFTYLGPEGTFAEQALRTLAAAARASRTPARSVPEALEAVRTGDADAAMVPLENSIGGAVGVTLDELTTGQPLMISREVVLPVVFVLAARTAIPLAAVRTVAAHPQAATQCRGWLQHHLGHAAVVDSLSNGAAAADTAAGRYDAAVCAPVGAGRHRLAVLADAIADHPAVTRFALVTRPGPPPEPTGDDVTSLAVWISHDRAGALLAVLREFAVRGVNLTRIESRPTGERLGRYVFLLDCAGHVGDHEVGEAVQGLRRICAAIRFLGSYPRHRHPALGAGPGGTGPAADPAAGPAPAAPADMTDRDFTDAAAWLARVRAGTLD